MASGLSPSTPLSLELLQRALGATSSGVVVTDPTLPDNPIVYVNPAFERVTGYAASEVLGRNCRFLQGEETDPVARVRIRDALARGEEVHVTLRNHRKDGTPFWNDLSISPVLADGRVTHFIGVQTDVTDRAHAERTQQAHDFAESVYETVREGLIVLDRSLRVVRANRNFYRIFRVTAEETVGQRIYELGNGQWNIAALRLLLERILPTKNPFDDFVVEHDFPSIGQKTMLLNARRLDRRGEPQFILLAIEDITQRQHNVQALRESERRYELLVEGLTA